MHSLKKVALIIVILGVIVSGFTFSGCFYAKNKNPETTSRQDKDSVATIEHQEASGDLTSTEAALEKDSVRRSSLFLIDSNRFMVILPPRLTLPQPISREWHVRPSVLLDGRSSRGSPGSAVQSRRRRELLPMPRSCGHISIPVW